mmetsp:Transcript_47962/g.53694  ORF Transcript_47962/g.53694 Transcript_47962/m.53694 type:complete len:92 (-) Transcript_47962:324-599(-)
MKKYEKEEFHHSSFILPVLVSVMRKEDMIRITVVRDLLLLLERSRSSCQRRRNCSCFASEIANAEAEAEVLLLLLLLGSAPPVCPSSSSSS